MPKCCGTLGPPEHIIDKALFSRPSSSFFKPIVEGRCRKQEQHGLLQTLQIKYKKVLDHAVEP